MPHPAAHCYLCQDGAGATRCSATTANGGRASQATSTAATTHHNCAVSSAPSPLPPPPPYPPWQLAPTCGTSVARRTRLQRRALRAGATAQYVGQLRCSAGLGGRRCCQHAGLQNNCSNNIPLEPSVLSHTHSMYPSSADATTPWQHGDLPTTYKSLQWPHCSAAQAPKELRPQTAAWMHTRIRSRDCRANQNTSVSVANREQHVQCMGHCLTPTAKPLHKIHRCACPQR